MHTYVVLGAGLQGVAAAYDFGKFGDAKTIILADINIGAAEQASARLNTLLKQNLVTARQVDVTNSKAVAELLTGADVCLSAVPYFFNVNLTKAAIAARCSFCDLGGNTDVVFEQHAFDDEAKAAGISVVPDCGLAPGMANILAAYGIHTISNPQKALIRVGGLPQNPRPPLGYGLFFSMEGLTNEYFGKAHVLRKGKRTEVDTFTELEKIEFPQPFGMCEAFMTAGGTSTCPWTFERVIDEFDEKTIRYPGHFEKMKAVHELGLLDLDPVDVDGQKVIPRHLFHAVVGPILASDDLKDVVLLRVTVEGDSKLIMELIDTYDESTGFTAMQRTTGFGAAMVAIMLAKGEVEKGCVRIERAIDGATYIEEMRKRGFDLKMAH